MPSRFAQTVPLGVRVTAAAALELAVPVRCGGCGTSGSRWCPRCAATLADDPIELCPRVHVGVPTWAMGRYHGPRRSAILAMKERNRGDLIRPLGAALARGLVDLGRWGETPADARHLALVPAPTRALSARLRGGDPVTALARHCATLLGDAVSVHPVLRTSVFARDSARLGARDRIDNLDQAVDIRRPTRSLARLRDTATAVVLVDDVLTTGATAAESVRVLNISGVRVHAVLVVAGA